MHNDKYTDEEENSDEDIDDMDFLKTYKAQRMEELKAIKNLPHYGSVKELESPYELLDEINNSDKVTPVVVHLYEDFEPACRALNRCMNDAAPKLWHVKVRNVTLLPSLMTSHTFIHICCPICNASLSVLNHAWQAPKGAGIPLRFQL